MSSPTRLDAFPAGTDEPILSRWLIALRQDAPRLPTPIALAMVQGIRRSRMGEPLHGIERGLMLIENENLSDLTGSEVKVLSAVLHQMDRTIRGLDLQIAQLYSGKDK